MIKICRKVLDFSNKIPYVIETGGWSPGVKPMELIMEIQLPKSYEVTAQRGEAKVTIDVSKLSVDIVEKLAMHGLRQKVADAAASAKKASEEEGETRTVAEIAEALMTKVVKNLEAGEWGAERGAGTSVDPMDKYRIQVVRGALKSNPKLKAQYDAIDSTDQKARLVFLMEIARAKADVVDPAAEKLKELADAAARSTKTLDL